MKFVLLVEGDTERDVLPEFLKRCLEPELKKNIGIQAVKFRGWANLWQEAPTKAKFYLRGPGASPDIIAVISILDLYGPDIYPDDPTSAKERHTWAKKELEKEVNHPRFRHYFAVHELEAWLLSQPRSFPRETVNDLEALSAKPEEVNFDSPPKQRLNKIFNNRLKRGYLPRVDGAKLFRLLLPTEARSKCPYFSTMIDELIALARNSGTGA